MVENKNEPILDKYGRVGHLINIGEYYLFQPNELNYENISIFDRSVPIDYKHSFINFEINKDISKNKDAIEETGDIPDIHQHAKNILNESRINFNLALEYKDKEKLNQEKYNIP